MKASKIIFAALALCPVALLAHNDVHAAEFVNRLCLAASLPAQAG
jgi:hypothetical protein